MADIAVWIDRKTSAFRQRLGADIMEEYVLEVLEHAGIPHRTMERLEWDEASTPDILIAALDDDTAEGAERLLRYAECGGIVISYGGIAKMAGALGCTPLGTANIGYLIASTPWDYFPPLRAFEISAWSLPEQRTSEGPKAFASGEVTGETLNTCPGLLSIPVGRGWVERWAVPIPVTIAGMQQGRLPIVKDGVPAPDGTANLDDGVLKADDGMAMEWHRDRKTTSTGQAYFAFPYADFWRQLLIGHLMRTALRAGLIVPHLGYWPEGVRCTALISFDSDGNVDEQAYSTLRELRTCGIRTVWCMLEPGYSSEVYTEVRKDGHELALHFDALVEGAWCEEEFRRQFAWAAHALGPDAVISNKNHLTRFEGWGELFEWCERFGIESDQTRGPSKAGNVGFLFGTCHPHFPMARWDQHNRRYNVLEIPFLTQDMDYGTSSRADSSIIEPLLDEVEAVEGTAHFLFHQMHIHERPSVARALHKLSESLRRRNIPVWTGKEVNEWERRRRSIRITGIDADGRPQVRGDCSDAVVWIPLSNDTSDEGGEWKFGVKCRRYSVSDVWNRATRNHERTSNK